MVICAVKQMLKFGTYTLSDGKNEYELIFEFYGIDEVEKGDKILIHENLLDTKSREFTQPYAFELTKTKSPKEVKDENSKEFIVLNKDKKNYVLKRIYG